MLPGLKLVDFSDRELMLLVLDLAEAGGWVTSQAVADQLNIDAERPATCVSTRFAWLRRYGAMERELAVDEKGVPLLTRGGTQKYTQRWRLTEIGKRIALGTLSKRDQIALERLEDNKLLMATRFVAERGRNGDDTLRTMLSREWKFSTSPLRNL